MTVTRVFPDMATAQLGMAKEFYGEIIGMMVVMDLGWIISFAGSGQANLQFSFAV